MEVAEPHPYWSVLPLRMCTHMYAKRMYDVSQYHLHTYAGGLGGDSFSSVPLIHEHRSISQQTSKTHITATQTKQVTHDLTTNVTTCVATYATTCTIKTYATRHITTHMHTHAKEYIYDMLSLTPPGLQVLWHHPNAFIQQQILAEHVSFTYIHTHAERERERRCVLTALCGWSAKQSQTLLTGETQNSSSDVNRNVDVDD